MGGDGSGSEEIAGETSGRLRNARLLEAIIKVEIWIPNLYFLGQNIVEIGSFKGVLLSFLPPPRKTINKNPTFIYVQVALWKGYAG